MESAAGFEKTYDILVASPNAALDSYYLLPELLVGNVNRAEQSLHTAGGKGNNLARAAHALGGRIMSLGIVGGFAGQYLLSELEREGISFDVVWTQNETRRSSTLLHSGQMQTTVVLDSGSGVDPEAGERLVDKILGYASQAAYLVLTGSLPPELPAGYYAQIVRLAKSFPGLQVCIDCSGESLRLAVEQGVQVIKVNVNEFQNSFHCGKDWKLQPAVETFTHLEKEGLQLLVVTDGARGAYIFPSGRPPFRVFTKVESWISTAGAGDTFMAALLLGLRRGCSLEAATCYASAAASATLQQAVCGSLRMEDVQHFLPMTAIDLLLQE